MSDLGTCSHASSGKRRKDCYSLILTWALSPGTFAMAHNDAFPALASHLMLTSHSRGPHWRAQPKPQVKPNPHQPGSAIPFLPSPLFPGSSEL